MDNSKLGNYILFLKLIQGKIDKFFDNQKDFIFCKKGCAKCCKHAQFPYTEIEFRLLVQGMSALNQETLLQVLENIENIIQERKKHFEETPDKKFEYDCPMLVNDACSVYAFRGLICRCFGLMSFLPETEGNLKVPFCAYDGLNYSNVLDPEDNSISVEKYKKLGLKSEPKAFNAGYAALIDKEFAKGFDFEFGEVKPLIEWFEIFGKDPKKE